MEQLRSVDRSELENLARLIIQANNLSEGAEPPDPLQYAVTQEVLTIDRPLADHFGLILPQQRTGV